MEFNPMFNLFSVVICISKA